MFNWFRKHSPLDDAATALYEKIVAQARQPRFYARMGVPDTLDGRFDMIVLHAFLVFYRLKDEGPAAREVSQKVFNAMFEDFDHSLREMGVGDISVAKRVKKMAAAFYGRAHAYGEAVDAKDAERLRDAIDRNFFPEGAGNGDVAGLLADYVLKQSDILAGQPAPRFVEGQVQFSAP